MTALEEMIENCKEEVESGYIRFNYTRQCVRELSNRRYNFSIFNSLLSFTSAIALAFCYKRHNTTSYVGLPFIICGIALMLIASLICTNRQFMVNEINIDDYHKEIECDSLKHYLDRLEDIKVCTDSYEKNLLHLSKVRKISAVISYIGIIVTIIGFIIISF